jgi:hypothetical protein
MGSERKGGGNGRQEPNSALAGNYVAGYDFVLTSNGGFQMSVPPGEFNDFDRPPEYATPKPKGRPGILTAVGIASIIVGSLSVLGSLISAASEVVYINMHPSTGPDVLTITASILSVGLAVVLIVAGSLTVRNSPKMRQLHLFWAICKIPLVFMSAIAFWWSESPMVTSAYTGFDGIGNSTAILAAAGSAVFSLIYPITLFIVFASAGTREYFRKLQAYL